MNSSMGRVECPSVKMAPSGHCISCGKDCLLIGRITSPYDKRMNAKFVRNGTSSNTHLFRLLHNVSRLKERTRDTLQSTDITHAIDSICYDGFIVKPAFIDPNGHMNVGYYA